MAVYGNFLSSFPELFRTVIVKQRGEPDWSRVRAIYIPKGGSGIDRQKLTAAHWDGEISDDDFLYVGRKYLSLIKIGTYVKIDNETYTIVNLKDFLKQGGFIECLLERQQGATEEQNQHISFKEGTYR